jgi:hypothetical protein
MPFPDFVGGECEKKVTVTKEESKGESRLKRKKKTRFIFTIHYNRS